MNPSMDGVFKLRQKLITQKYFEKKLADGTWQFPINQTRL